MKHILSFSFFILIIISGCKKSNDVGQLKPSRENILNDKAHIVDASAISSVTLSSLMLNKSKLTFQPSVGDIILASPSISNPKGVIAKIISLTTSGNTVNCTIQSSNLNEAFRQLYIDYKYNKDYKARVSGSVLGIPLPQELTAGFSVKGMLQLNIPDVEIKYSKKEGNTLPDTVLILANVNTKGSGLEMKASGKLNVPEKTLYTFNNLPIIEVPIIVGGVPLIIPFWQYVNINTLPLNISGKMKFTIIPEFSASLGISYINGDWKDLSSYNIGASGQKLIKTDFDASLTADVIFFNPEYRIGPFWDPTLYTFFKVPNQLVGKIQTQTPNYSLIYKLGIESGIHYDFWFGKGEKSFSIPVYSTTLQEGNWESSKKSVKIDFDIIPKSRPDSLIIQGITIKALNPLTPYLVAPSPSIGCSNLKNSYFIINDFGIDGELKNVHGLSHAPAGIFTVDLSKFNKVDSITIIGSNSAGFGRTAFFSVCDSTSKHILTINQPEIKGDFTRTIKIGRKANRFIHYSLLGYIYSMEIFYE